MDTTTTTTTTTLDTLAERLRALCDGVARACSDVSLPAAYAAAVDGGDDPYDPYIVDALMDHNDAVWDALHDRLVEVPGIIGVQDVLEPDYDTGSDRVAYATDIDGLRIIATVDPQTGEASAVWDTGYDAGTVWDTHSADAIASALSGDVYYAHYTVVRPYGADTPTDGPDWDTADCVQLVIDTIRGDLSYYEFEAWMGYDVGDIDWTRDRDIAMARADAGWYVIEIDAHGPDGAYGVAYVMRDDRYERIEELERAYVQWVEELAAACARHDEALRQLELEERLRTGSGLEEDEEALDAARAATQAADAECERVNQLAIDASDALERAYERAGIAYSGYMGDGGYWTLEREGKVICDIITAPI